MAEKRTLKKMLRGVATGRAAGVRRAVVALIMLAALAAGLGTNPLAAQQSQAPQPPSDAAIQTLADQAIRRLDLQTELLRQPEPFGWRLNLPPEALWFAVVVGVALLFYAFRDMLPFLGMRRDGAWQLDEAGAAESGPASPRLRSGPPTISPRKAASSRPCTCFFSRRSPKSAGASTSSSPIP